MSIVNYLRKKFYNQHNFRNDFRNACMNGDLERVKWLYEVSVHYDIIINNHGNIFSDTCSYGHVEIVKFLVELSEKKDTYINIDTSFNYAKRKSHLEVMKYLIKMGDERKSPIDIHASNEEAFRCACSNDHLEVVKFLIQFGRERGREIDIDIIKKAFQDAGIKGLLEVMKYLFEMCNERKDPIDIYQANFRVEFELFNNLRIIYKDILQYSIEKGFFPITKWILSFYSNKQLKRLNYPYVIVVKEELENRKKINIDLILYLNEKKFKLLDIRAIAISWREFL